MMQFQGRTVLSGRGRGPALFTDQAVNFTAAFTKAGNLLPWKRGQFHDRHHPWFGEQVRGKVLVFPACIGSTHTGLVILDLVRMEEGPAALIVDRADSLLVSGIVLSAVWYGPSITVVEYSTAELREAVLAGQLLDVDGDTGIITF
jgi:predicted aconitase with swiveling domain